MPYAPFLKRRTPPFRGLTLHCSQQHMGEDTVRCIAMDGKRRLRTG
jgi:hypothetical protein